MRFELDRRQSLGLMGAALGSTVLSQPLFAAPGTRPPVAKVNVVKDTYFGETLSDPYRWMENDKDPDWLPFLKGQNDYARSVLDTLPLRHVRAGYAEIVKYGLIDDPAFFDWCEANAPALLAGDPAARAYAIAHSVAAKARIVAEDERETTGKRALLNLGHTFGHALEAEAGFSDLLLHGEGVAAGMALAFGYSAAHGLAPAADAERVAIHLRTIGLPDGPAAAGIHADGATLVAHMLHDKKMDAGTLPFLLARGIGATYLDKNVALADVARFLDRAA